MLASLAKLESMPVSVRGSEEVTDGPSVRQIPSEFEDGSGAGWELSGSSGIRVTQLLVPAFGRCFSDFFFKFFWEKWGCKRGRGILRGGRGKKWGWERGSGNILTLDCCRVFSENRFLNLILHGK